MPQYRLTATLWQESGRRVSRCPEVGLGSDGQTLDGALEALREAVELYLENAKELGLLPNLELTLEAPHRFCSPLEVSVP